MLLARHLEVHLDRSTGGLKGKATIAQPGEAAPKGGLLGSFSFPREGGS
jgi:hypothetical protein